MLRRWAALGVAVSTLSGCAVTVAGEPVRAVRVEEPTVALMDTGPYAIEPSRRLGNAGDSPFAQGLLESQRMAAYVVGPWDFDDALRRRAFGAANAANQPIANVETLIQVVGDAPGVRDAATTHGLIAGFSTWRGDADDDGTTLLNAVLRFPDPPAAEAATNQLADALDAPMPGVSPRIQVPIDGHPAARAVSYTDASSTTKVRSLTAHGHYVLYQLALPGPHPTSTAESLISSTLDEQLPLIDSFAPTAVDQLPQLPLDPSDGLLPAALTSTTQEAGLPVSSGSWPPAGWLHFEDHPVSAERELADAGVDFIAQRLATVYRTRDDDAAADLADYLATTVGEESGVTRLDDAVPGLPSAQCFERAEDYESETAPMTWQWSAWHLKCVAHADRYAYTVFSQTLADAMQQAAAQYRILTGE